MSEGNEESLTPEVSRDSGGGKGKQMANKAANKAADKGKQLLKKAGKKGAAKGKLAAAAGPVIFWATVVIVIIIVLVGIIMFFATMPGMVMEKLKQIFKDLGNYLAAFFGADTTKQIDEKQIYQTLDYLEDMGYDVKGYGFLTDYYTSKEDKKVKDTLSEDERASAKYDSKLGLIRDGDNKILLAESDFIFTYITSDNYVYTLKNSNVATQNAAHNWLESFFMGVASFFTKLFSPLIDLFGATEGLVDAWGRGLIVAWYEKDNNFGEKGKIVDTNNWANHDTVKIDMEKKQLILAKNGWFSGNNPRTYSLDGWTGRYGMPLEFLLSVHVATMMPDLSYDMATSFNTNVNMYLHKVSGEVKVYYRPDGVSDDAGDIDLTELYQLSKIEDKIVWCFEHGLIKKTEAIVRYDSTKFKYEWAWFPIKIKTFRAHGEMHDDVYDTDGTKYTKSEALAHFDDETYIMKGHDGKVRVIDGVTGDTWAYSFKLDEANGKELQKAMQKIWDAGKNVPKKNYETYEPYIADVVNHWYRNVYFIVNKNSSDYNASKLEFVTTDYDYEAIFKERWTLYQVYEKTDLDELIEQNKLKEEDYDTFYKNQKLFVTNKNGYYYSSSTNGEYTVVGLPEEIEKNPKVVLDPGDTGLYLYLGTKEEAQEEDIIVSKKAVTYGISNEDDLKDIGWNTLKTNSNIWSAYTVDTSKPVDSGHMDGYTDDEEGSDEEKGHIYSGVTINNFNIQQEGEGLRTETNPQIKKMFLSNTYFRYDGSNNTAEIITALRKKLLTDLHSEYGLASDKEGTKYGPLNEYYGYYFSGSGLKVTDVTDRHYKASELGFKVKEGEEDKDYYVKDYSGQVSLNQDSLNAFTMLENIHTLDADYIYRDFKELVVELGYFTKEELTDELPKLLAFPVPQTGSYLYPDRSIDKRENEYGTMIHSKGDIAANMMLSVYGTTADEEGSGSDDEGTENTDYTEFYSDYDTGEIAGEDDSEDVDVGGDKKKPEDFFSDKRSNAYHVDITGDEIAEDAKQMWESMATIPGETNTPYWEYCVGVRPEKCEGCINSTTSKGEKPHICKDYEHHINDYCLPRYKELTGNNEAEACKCGKPNHCNHVSHDKRGCGYMATFEGSVKATGSRNVCCAVFVSWVLKELGVEVDSIMSEFGGSWSGAYSVSRMCVEYLGAEIIEDFDELEPGDIMAYVLDGGGGIGHVDIVGAKDGDTLTIYGCGKVPNPQDWDGTNPKAGWNVPGTYTKSSFNDRSNGKLAFGMRIAADKKSDFYRGYLGNEAVVSPVTGILLEYGTYDPNTETGKDVDSITGEEYRVNVDLKYGPLNMPQASDDEEESSEGEEETEGEKFESQIVSDKVGYAKILVLDKDYYYNLEQSTDNSWNEKTGTKESLLEDDGSFRDELEDSKDGKILAKDLLHSKDKNIRWSEEDQTIYAYKEFAETYEKAGIAGHIVLIDGFVCEAPDNSLGKTKVPMKIPYENKEDKRIENTYTIDPDVTTGINFTSVTFDNFKDKQLKSKYYSDEEYKLASKRATDKLLAEQDVKMIGSTSLYIDECEVEDHKDEKLIYIKEGTILGRTMTDKELLEGGRIREEDTGTYEDNRPYSTRTNIEENDKVIGNYVRVVMRDLDGTPVEDVEDYMKLDDMEELTDDVLFMAGVITAEAGGKGDGAKACAWVIRNRVKCGAFQDTLGRVLVAPNQFTVVNKDPKKCSGWIYQGDLISIKVDGVKYYVSKPTEEAIKIAKQVWHHEDYQDIKDKLKKGSGAETDFEKKWGRLYWKSAGTGSGRRGALQIPEGKGNWFHY